MVHSFNTAFMKYKYNDGGRSHYTNTPSKHDCAVRAIAIAAGLSYWEVYQQLTAIAPALESEGIDAGGPAFTNYLRGLGFVRVHGITTMQDIPTGRVIASTTGHVTAIIDGVINDVRDESSRAVPYYWVKGTAFNLIRDGKKVNGGAMNGTQAMTMRGGLQRYNPNGKYIHVQAV